jgi:hypothetical protein
MPRGPIWNGSQALLCNIWSCTVVYLVVVLNAKRCVASPPLLYVRDNAPREGPYILESISINFKLPPEGIFKKMRLTDCYSIWTAAVKKKIVHKQVSSRVEVVLYHNLCRTVLRLMQRCLSCVRKQFYFI